MLILHISSIEKVNMTCSENDDNCSHIQNKVNLMYIETTGKLLCFDFQNKHDKQILQLNKLNFITFNTLR